MEELRCPHCNKTFTIDESGYAAIVSQIRDKEFEKQIRQSRKEMEEKQESLIENAVLKSKGDYEKKINLLEGEIKAQKNEYDRYVKEAEKEQKRAVEDAIRDEHDKVKDLETKLKTKDMEYDLSLQQKDKIHSEEMRLKDEEIERIKDFKAKQSTKMIGENLEQFCETEFNKMRAAAFKSAYFEKDNDAKTGSKGDYIFRDFIEGTDEEYVSIMFEMKNEADTTKTKHKNEDFFKELDKDRREKKCEYAILVSMLESDNDYYNTGIVDVSHKYPKMYVIRPQYFIPVITFLRNASMNSVEAKKELMDIRAKNIDVTTFEESLLNFKSQFGRNYNLANDRFNKAIEEIDKTIEHLEKVKSELMASGKQLGYANDKLENLTIKKLTKNNETMQKMFEEAGADLGTQKK